MLGNCWNGQRGIHELRHLMDDSVQEPNLKYNVTIEDNIIVVWLSSVTASRWLSSFNEIRWSGLLHTIAASVDLPFLPYALFDHSNGEKEACSYFLISCLY
jgi:DUF2075 family protein